LRKAILLDETVLNNPWIPPAIKSGLTDKQVQFLTCEGREAMYGGSAGGGKSFALLMAALQFVDVPTYHALILRRTYAQLSKAESIMSVSKEWLTGRRDAEGRPANWNGDTYTWTFPGGATLAFGHMKTADDRFNYQGAAYAYVGYDELTQFEELMYTYLFSRQRRKSASEIPLRMRAASNPGGIGHEWVKRRFIDPKTRKPGVVFIPAKLEDNPNLDRDSYVQSLNELDPITRSQLLAGDWNAVAGGRFLPGWFRYFMRRGDYLTFDERRSYHLNECRKFLTVDPAASDNNSADYTVISAWAVTPVHDLCWLGCHRGRWEIPDIVPQIQAAYKRWRASSVGIEAVASNAAVYQLARRTPMTVTQVSPAGRSKLVRATGAMVLASDGRIWLPAPEADPTFPLEDVLAEVSRFTGDDSQDAHDDIVDTLSYAVELRERMPTETARRQVPMVLGNI
jgi:hypothetical protein